ncbi:MAG TPA: hypothetical protein VEB39_05900 [Sphingomicrobium sp.]|nr:hypothetical protein [Sphingomicrobium sp.]
MSWAGKQHPLEVAVEWLAPIPLASAAGWAGSRLGFSSVEAVALGFAVMAAGFGAIRLGGGVHPIALRSFEPPEFEVELGELVLEEKDAVLELTDRLNEVAPDSRVVRLFAREDATPGELVDRIAYFLGEGRGPTPPDRVAAEDSRPDARAALHDALANIRASLR